MLLASRRLTDDPRASFGAIAGVIMAVFVASASSRSWRTRRDQDFDRAGVLAADQVYVEMPYNEGPPFAEVPARIAAVPGVRSVLPIATAELHGGRPGHRLGRAVRRRRATVRPPGERLRDRRPVHSLLGSHGRSEPGTYTLVPDRGDRRPITLTIARRGRGVLRRPREPVADRLPQLIIEPDALAASGQRRAPTKFYVTTDGSATTGERLRTAVLASVPTAYVRLAAESRATSRIFEEFGRVVGLGLIGTLVLAGCSLAVAVTHERARTASPVRPAAQRRDARVASAGARPAAGRARRSSPSPRSVPCSASRSRR